MTNTTITCPHCGGKAIIEQLNCGIFRHAIFKDGNQQVNPHADEATCNWWISQKLIYGCGQPFQIIVKENKFIAIKCGFI